MDGRVIECAIIGYGAAFNWGKYHMNLMLTHSAGFKHDYLPIAEEVVIKLGRESKVYEATTTEDCSVINATNLFPNKEQTPCLH